MSSASSRCALSTVFFSDPRASGRWQAHRPPHLPVASAQVPRRWSSSRRGADPAHCPVVGCKPTAAGGLDLRTYAAPMEPSPARAHAAGHGKSRVRLGSLAVALSLFLTRPPPYWTSGAGSAGRLLGVDSALSRSLTLASLATLEQAIYGIDYSRRTPDRGSHGPTRDRRCKRSSTGCSR